MKIPGTIKFVLFSTLAYKILSIKPVKKFLLGLLIAKGAKMLQRRLT